jgi:hypothetical protein
MALGRFGLGLEYEAGLAALAPSDRRTDGAAPNDGELYCRPALELDGAFDATTLVREVNQRDVESRAIVEDRMAGQPDGTPLSAFDRSRE